MKKSNGPWQPQVGDHVRIKGQTVSTLVHRINGTGSDRRYVLLDVAPERTAYWIEEITPGG